MDKEIDLGVSSKEQYPGGMPMSSPPESTEKVYPRLHISGPAELDLPGEGEMEIKFRKVSESHQKRGDGSDWYECCIEVRCICEVEGEDEEPETPTKKFNGAEEALDKLAEALKARKEDEAG